jgi:hypothetical protein
MVRFSVPAVNKDYPDGGKAIRLLEDASGFVYYRSGRIAVSVTSTDLGFIQHCYDDNNAHTVLLHFDEIGQGSVTHPTPKRGTTAHPRYVCDPAGGKFVSESGEITNEWPWEAPIGASWTPTIPPEWSFSLNSCLTFTASNRQNMHLEFKCNGVVQEFDVGEMRRRKENYLETQYFSGRVRDGPSRGKVILSVPKVIDSYHEDLAGLRASYRNPDGTWHIDSGEGGAAELTATMGSMELSQNLSKVSEHTRRMRSGGMSVRPFTEPDVLDTLRSTVENPSSTRFGAAIVPDPHHECGSGHAITPCGPQPAQMKTFHDGVVLGMGRYHGSTKLDRSFSIASGRYVESLTSRPTARRALRLIKTKDYDKFLTSVSATQLLLVAVIHDGEPQSRQTLGMLETKWGEIAGPAPPKRKPGQPKPPSQDLDALPVRFVRFSATESRLLINRYNFHCAPMFLIYYGAPTSRLPPGG